MPMLIDTHTHLDVIADYYADYIKERGDDSILREAPEPAEQSEIIPADKLAIINAIMARARTGDVRAVLQVACDYPSNFVCREIARLYTDVRIVVGLHPHEAGKITDAQIDEMKEWLAWDSVAAVGEIGLDYYRDWSPFDLQRKWFEAQLALADEAGLPVVIHNREADEDTYERLKSVRPRGGIIMHCFGSDADQARKFLDLGAYISFAGNVTFKKSLALQDAARVVPPDRLLVETDAPFMTPVPHRGKINEPSYVVHTARFLSELKGIDFETFCETAVANSRAAFPALQSLQAD